MSSRHTSCTVGYEDLTVFRVDDHGVRTIVGQAYMASRIETALTAKGGARDVVTSHYDLQTAWGEATSFRVRQSVSCACITVRSSGARVISLLRPHPVVATTVSFLMAPGQIRSKIRTTLEHYAASARNDTSRSLARFRCDRLALFGSRGTSSGGCVYARYSPTWKVSKSGKYPHFAAHVARAQKALHLHWGDQALGGRPLTRTTDRALRRINRRTAQQKCKELGVTSSCDEYPFASTTEGCFRVTCHVAGIPLTENSGAGGALNGFYKRNRIMSGDIFWVEVVK